MSTFTLLDDAHPVEIDASPGDGLTIAPSSLEGALGWELKPEGLCRDDVCVRIPDGTELWSAGRIDLSAVARLLGRPFVADPVEWVASLGASPGERSMALASLDAPDFELPDVDGRVHSLSQQRGKKVFLAAWASW